MADKPNMRLTDILTGTMIDTFKNTTEPAKPAKATETPAEERVPAGTPPGKVTYGALNPDALGLGKAQKRAVLGGVMRHIKPDAARVDPKTLAMRHVAEYSGKHGSPKAGSDTYNDLAGQGVLELLYECLNT